MVRPLAAEPTDVDGGKRFRVERSEPNYPGKIVWCVSNNSWKLSFRKSDKGTERTTSFNDASGKPLKIADGLDSAAYTAQRKATYARAITAWNMLDKSKDNRIPSPSASARAFRVRPARAQAL